MEIEIEFGKGRWMALGAAVAIIVAIALLGRAVTPVEAGEPQFLTPERWQAYKLARQAAGEIEALRRDADALGAILDEPEPVEAMLLAQRIYARHRSGTGATATAREALIEAAQAVVLYASGGAEQAEAAAAYQNAVRLIRALGKR